MMNVSALRNVALPLAITAAVVLPATAASAAPAPAAPTVQSAPVENPYCDWRSGYGCEGYGYTDGNYPNDDDANYYGHHRHHHHYRHWRY